MSIKLSDTQQLMLQDACQREDRCIELPPRLKGGAAQRVAAKLVALGLAREMRAKAGMPVWRRDADQAFALKLTAAGLKAAKTDTARGGDGDSAAKTQRMILKNSPMKLTDAQFAILFEASQHEDRCLISPSTLKGGAAQKLAAMLLTAGLVREIKAKAGKEAWRRDKETGQAYSLKLTGAGLKAIAADERESQPVPSTAVLPNTNEGPPKAKAATDIAAAGKNDTTAPTSSAPRQGTKIARVVELLQRDQGAKLDELIAATGWLPHTARAALTGLRHCGYEVRLERGENGQASVYRALSTVTHAS